LIIIGIILYFIAKNYKTEEFQNINLKKKEKFEGDLKNHEAGILVSLMAKVAKADGKVCELEAELIKNTLTDISIHFENQEEIREKLKDIYNEEKKSFDNTVTLCEKFYKITKNDYKKRLKVLEYLLNLAFIDKELSNSENMITEDISNALKIKYNDYENLVKRFESFYANASKNKQKSIEDAYELLESSSNDDFNIIKKRYRTLVKKHHPDIIKGQGGDETSIQKATQKLQEINEAYEIIKKEKN
jgi:DnaJ like chaperone protein